MILREVIPARSDPEEEKKYSRYKEQLRQDFNTNCGYCDDSDEDYGFARGFHIDHFAPKKLFPELECNYTNLVYSCPVCNIAKSATWFGQDACTSHDGERGFIDPCSAEYDDHLVRLASGRIVGVSPLGKYKEKKLKLNLIRHQLNWQIRTLFNLMSELDELIELAAANREDLLTLKEALVDVTSYYINAKGRRRAAL